MLTSTLATPTTSGSVSLPIVGALRARLHALPNHLRDQPVRPLAGQEVELAIQLACEQQRPERSWSNRNANGVMWLLLLLLLLLLLVLLLLLSLLLVVAVLIASALLMPRRDLKNALLETRGSR